MKSSLTKKVKALALIGLALSLIATFVPGEQFAVAILASILAIVTGFYGEVIYTTGTAAVTGLNMAMLSPHNDLVMAEQPVQIYCTALLWSAAPAVSMIAGYLVHVPSRKGLHPARTSEQSRKM
jgi:hypothetical protein